MIARENSLIAAGNSPLVVGVAWDGVIPTVAPWRLARYILPEGAALDGAAFLLRCPSGAPAKWWKFLTF